MIQLCNRGIMEAIVIIMYVYCIIYIIHYAIYITPTRLHHYSATVHYSATACPDPNSDSIQASAATVARLHVEIT